MELMCGIVFSKSKQSLILQQFWKNLFFAGILYFFQFIVVLFDTFGDLVSSLFSPKKLLVLYLKRKCRLLFRIDGKSCVYGLKTTYMFGLLFFFLFCSFLFQDMKSSPHDIWDNKNHNLIRQRGFSCLRLAFVYISGGGFPE